MLSCVLAPARVPVARARSGLARRVARARRRACTRLSARDDADGASSSSSRAQQIRDEKASALREELDGVRARSRRLLARGGRLVERVAELTAAAERAMDAKDRDEDEARRLLVERKKVREALDLTMARAEVLQQLASKLETAVIVLEREPIQDEDDAIAGAGAGAASSKPTDPSSSSSRPRARDLDAEFRSLEVSQLERMLRMTPDADDSPDTVSSPTPTAATDPRDANASPPAADDTPAWWRRPSEDATTTATATASAASSSSSSSSSSSTSPEDALLDLDRARVSPGGVQPRHVLALRLACAADPAAAAAVSVSDRLEGGKRDVAFRAAVLAVVAAAEAREASSDPPWASLGGYPPDHFLSDVARDVGATPSRAGRLVADAAARRAGDGVLRAAAALRAGEEDDAAAEMERLARVLRALEATAGEHLALVAFGLEKQLREEERRKVLALFDDAGGDAADRGARDAVACALGLE
jgi:hypothetical protein